jgi:glycosyltransferase involved in cell wall biosynthesis
MKVNVIFLDYDRHQFTQQVKERNFKNAGYPFDFIEVDMKGISAALNKGIQSSRSYDAVVTMANDILMPDNWLLHMVEAAKAIPNTGMCGIHCVEGLEPMTEINGIKVHVNYTAFGNVLIPMMVINQIGFFNPEYDPYGMQDADYAYRLNNTGHVNYYLHGLKSEHLGHDVGQPSDYRRMKDEGLSKAGEVWERSTKRYEETGDYTINMIQYEGEAKID